MVGEPAPVRDVSFDRDLFMRRTLRELTGLLEGIVGLETASAYINSVGGAMGRWIEAEYRGRMGPEPLDAARVAQVLVDLKRRIGGDFYVIEVTDEAIVLGNRACPFGAMVEGRQSLCMMTSNVFGRIAADHLGYARVELKETIARGDRGCHVVVHLRRDDVVRADDREYYGVPAAGR